MKILGWIVLGLALAATVIVVIGAAIEERAAERRRQQDFNEMSRLIRRAREEDQP